MSLCSIMIITMGVCHMQIVDFTAAHIEQAAQIAKENYEAQRRLVPLLPPVDALLDFTPFSENGLGVAAFDGNHMCGFLCSVSPFENAFASTDAVGVFSPMGGNGAVGENRAALYARMYQAAGKKWVHAGASSHAICVYAQDSDVQAQFFKYGFGMRTVDALRDMRPIPAPSGTAYRFQELAPDEYASVFPLVLLLNAHQGESPFFMYRNPTTLQDFLNTCIPCGSRVFAAIHRGQPCAYLQTLPEGETVIAAGKHYLHIGGAFCLPEHRGKGVYQGLLNFTVSALKQEGITRLGVDFESLNPAAWHFWPKYFHVYSYGLVRRIDEHALL